MQVLQYNMTGGKRNRGLAVLKSYRLLAKNQNLSREDLHLATIMGWCLEMVQIQATVLDDSFCCIQCSNVQTGSAFSTFPGHRATVMQRSSRSGQKHLRMQNLTCEVRGNGV